LDPQTRVDARLRKGVKKDVKPIRPSRGSKKWTWEERRKCEKSQKAWDKAARREKVRPAGTFSYWPFKGVRKLGGLKDTRTSS